MATIPEDGTFRDMDDTTAALIIQLQLEDSQEIFDESQKKGKNVAGKPSDSQAAFQLSKEEMEKNAMILNDRIMARSINQAVRADAELLASSVAQEQAELGDRRLAFQLAGIAPPASPIIDSAPVEVDDRVLDVMAALFVEVPAEFADAVDEISEPRSDLRNNAGETSQWAMIRKNPTRPRLLCGICQEDGRFFEVTPVPCGDTYCRICLQDLFRRSFDDESLFPPRCCGQPFLPESIRLYLTEEIIQKYEEKKVEFETPNRTYCHVLACSEFILPISVQADCGTCAKCSAQTCTICKAEWHGTQDCPSDTGLQLVLATATREGWQRCTSCRRMVEHNLGCNHMTCYCGHQFCYECNERWKTCRCPVFHEHRLLAQAIDRAANAPAPAGVGEEARVLAAARAILAEHNCPHTDWYFTRGLAACANCGDVLTVFTHVCGGCDQRRCNTCLNRIGHPIERHRSRRI